MVEVVSPAGGWRCGQGHICIFTHPHSLKEEKGKESDQLDVFMQQEIHYTV